MIQGLYAAANGMLAVESRQAVIANNIANASTPGFKRQLAVQRGYYQGYSLDGRNPIHFDRMLAPGGGIRTTETFSDFGNGVTLGTSNPLDIGLSGPGFLTVDTPNGERYTRSGRFSMTEDGTLITLAGETVLDTNGEPIDVSGGEVEFDATGSIYVDGELRGKLGIVEFNDPHALTREGYTLYRAPDDVAAAATPALTTTVLPQTIENSNVQLPIEMISMTTALRSYAANQQVIQAINETANKMINQVGGL